jgi:hypothetical protein
MFCKDRESPEFYNSKGVFGQKITPAIIAGVIKIKIIWCLARCSILKTTTL